MVMSQHTPGPWKQGEGGPANQCLVFSQRVQVAKAWYPSDACLIAAAPEMYDLLERMSGDGWQVSDRREARVLLARIEGT
jgi:hypothetical protein